MLKSFNYIKPDWYIVSEPTEIIVLDSDTRKNLMSKPRNNAPGGFEPHRYDDTILIIPFGAVFRVLNLNSWRYTGTVLDFPRTANYWTNLQCELPLSEEPYLINCELLAPEGTLAGEVKNKAKDYIRNAN